VTFDSTFTARAGVGYGTAQLAGFGSRFVGYIIDVVLVAIVSGVLQAILHLGYLGTVISAAYFIYFWTTTGQTLGQQAMHIKVVKIDGTQITWVTALLRYIGYIISYFFLLGFLWMLWDPQKQGWMDKIAGTLVVKA
jgi:uncharacterized RDD family membrane protein YckC